jgi:hypothetical protein
LDLSSVNMGPAGAGPAHTPLAERRAASVAGGQCAPPPRPNRSPRPAILRGEAPAAETRTPGALRELRGVSAARGAVCAEGVS